MMNISVIWVHSILTTKNQILDESSFSDYSSCFSEWGKQLFFIYFGLPKVGLSISAEVCGAVGLGLLGGSYMAESFRSELEAVPVLQMESKRNQCVFSNQPDISCSQYGIRNFTWND